MSGSGLRLTYVGGSTALLELGGLRLLTDPTFDPAGTEYPTPVYVLRKTRGPAVAPDGIGPVDAVLLSHDHHFDNLDHAGHRLLASAREVVTTVAGAGRLGGNAVGLEPWQSCELPAPGGSALHVTATPARHGPPGGDRGPVIGFMLEPTDRPEDAVYVSGDTVWYEGVAEVARRFAPRVAVLFAGAARVRVAGPANLTFTAAEAVAAARAFPRALIVPLHFEGWEHFTESREDVARAFAEAGLADRLRWPVAGRPWDPAAPLS
jgi:L-ascorbate metabolism protein UlaG (beta-lactamase superfamily)